MPLLRFAIAVFFVSVFCSAYGQQDIDFHLNTTLLQGKNILKVKRDFNDPYLWVLAQNNEVYRINSLDNSVDNYTAQFSAYNGFQFIDIAGRSLDTVFIATNSTNVLEYKKGVIKNIGAAQGIAGTVNSIGIDNVNGQISIVGSAYTALIATDNGICRYDYKSETMMPVPMAQPARIFEMTYRNEMVHGIDICRCAPDTVEKYGVTELVFYTVFGGEIWLGANSFGHILKSAFFTKGSIFGNDNFSFLANQFWATENGLFQNTWEYSYHSSDPYKHYLKGVNINKITSIYGLQILSQPSGYGKSRENLLIGSDQGLYFSNSNYQNLFGGSPPLYQFFHYDELGNKKINDICVNANTYAVRSPYNGIICEDGVWVAAIDGLYLLKPDYVPYINTATKLQAIQFGGANANLNEIQTCSNVTTTASVLFYAYAGNLVQWYKDGQEIPNESKTTLNITQSGDYNAVLYDPCSPVHFETNHLKVTVISAPIFAFDYPDRISYCDGSTATLKTDNNAIYQYRWYKDGVLNGNTSSILTTTQSGKYKIEVSTCSGNWVASKEVQIDFIKVPQPLVNTDKAAYCAGDKAVLTATVPIDATGIVNWGAYQYRWYKDGVLNGITTASMNAAQPGKYRVEVTSCSGSWVASQEKQVDFINLTTPVITANKPAYCIGDAAVLSINFVNDGTFTINWTLDGNMLTANQNKSSITTASPGSYTAVISSNLTSCAQSSVVYPLTFETPPVISLERIVNTTLCDGQTVDLKAIFNNGAITWSTGETTDKISVKQSGTYSAAVTTLAGCVVSTDINVQFLAKPVINVPDATLCQFTNDEITLTAPAGFVSYEWNGRAGDKSYTTGTLGTVILTVTDNNGCKASQTINITSHCKDVHIPNTFTPNGDGINDKWVITGLEGDPSANVKIYNRQGELLFQSQGYTDAWGGTYNGKKLPAGVYFYVISTKGANQVLSGSITIIY